MKLLDCTLRDGGYYTNWDFDKELVKNYCKSMITTDNQPGLPRCFLISSFNRLEIGL